jgi:hypothetical protein
MSGIDLAAARAALPRDSDYADFRGGRRAFVSAALSRRDALREKGALLPRLRRNE